MPEHHDGHTLVEKFGPKQGPRVVLSTLCNANPGQTPGKLIKALMKEVPHFGQWNHHRGSAAFTRRIKKSCIKISIC